MDQKTLKNYCFSHRNRTSNKLVFLMNHLLEDSCLSNVLFKDKSKDNVLDLELLEIIGYSFICALKQHLRPEFSGKYSEIIKTLENSLKCPIGLRNRQYNYSRKRKLF